MTHIVPISVAELGVTVKFRVFPLEACEDFVSKYEELPKKEYLYNVVGFVVANIDSEVKPALAGLEPAEADKTLVGLYNGCIMLNPVLGMNDWGELLRSHNPLQRPMRDMNAPEAGGYQYSDDSDPTEVVHQHEKSDEPTVAPKRKFSLTKAKLNAMPKFLKGRVVGQDESIDVVWRALKRYQVGLNDAERPIGVFLFAGPSGVGKTYLAKELQSYLFNNEVPMVRIDCGEFQHKHENQKLIGAPSGYAGYEDGGFLYRAMSQTNGATVVLLDEIEKAHRDFWDTFLKVFDDGYITDAKGNIIDFRSCLFVLTSNLGNEKISDTEFGRQTGFTSNKIGGDFDSTTAPRREMVVRVTNEHIRKYFKPEFLNRVDEVVVFNHLSSVDFRGIADLQFKKVAQKLSSRSVNLEWSSAASDLLVAHSSKAMMGARSMAKVRRSEIEDELAQIMITKTPTKGTTFKIDAQDGAFVFK